MSLRAMSLCAAQADSASSHGGIPHSSNSKASGKFAKLSKTPAQGMGNPLSAPNGILYEAK